MDGWIEGRRECGWAGGLVGGREEGMDGWMNKRGKTIVFVSEKII